MFLWIWVKSVSKSGKNRRETLGVYAFAIFSGYFVMNALSINCTTSQLSMRYPKADHKHRSPAPCNQIPVTATHRELRDILRTYANWRAPAAFQSTDSHTFSPCRFNASLIESVDSNHPLPYSERCLSLHRQKKENLIDFSLGCVSRRKTTRCRTSGSRVPSSGSKLAA